MEARELDNKSPVLARLRAQLQAAMFDAIAKHEVKPVAGKAKEITSDRSAQVALGVVYEALRFLKLESTLQCMATETGLDGSTWKRDRTTVASDLPRDVRDLVSADDAGTRPVLACLAAHAKAEKRDEWKRELKQWEKQKKREEKERKKEKKAKKKEKKKERKKEKKHRHKDHHHHHHHGDGSGSGSGSSSSSSKKTSASSSSSSLTSLGLAGAPPLKLSTSVKSSAPRGWTPAAEGKNSSSSSFMPITAERNAAPAPAPKKTAGGIPAHIAAKITKALHFNLLQKDGKMVQPWQTSARWNGTSTVADLKQYLVSREHYGYIGESPGKYMVTYSPNKDTPDRGFMVQESKPLVELMDENVSSASRMILPGCLALREK